MMMMMMMMMIVAASLVFLSRLLLALQAGAIIAAHSAMSLARSRSLGHYGDESTFPVQRLQAFKGSDNKDQVRDEFAVIEDAI